MDEGVADIAPSLVSSVGVVNKWTVEGRRAVSSDRRPHVVGVEDKDADLRRKKKN